ncbi:MAG: hypothetical protein EOP31_10290 [Rhodococcus sp. (in: high G+C Gram-positive bacteria)]|uniref:hypothetical protein n=1 Tax=Rhodococcus sp. TaxID=1831 RepID=UPI00121077F6|nr:hypothetical protein [Rhodococcus sp. (in: high G+C Gram-positive bacteria)]RZL25477.1 MAG: hypothetical protein EOP31_10290 [Rhodococcus sp. (in: high G+C Gram-positive bacteria)]
MSRLPGNRLSRRLPVALAGAAAVVALTAGSALVGAGSAAADPQAPAEFTVPIEINVPTDLAALIDQAGAISPEATAALNQLIGTAAADQIAETLGVNLGFTTPAPFMYPAPTVGCGLDGQMATVTLATAQSGPNFPLPPWVEDNQLRFQALPAYIGIPKPSELSVAWINTSTFKGGIVPLDETLPVVDTPLLSKVVDTGDGKVLAAIFGKVDYTDGKSCIVLPTVGSFDA